MPAIACHCLGAAKVKEIDGLRDGRLPLTPKCQLRLGDFPSSFLRARRLFFLLLNIVMLCLLSIDLKDGRRRV